MAVGLNSELLRALQESTCFGIAHDENVPECKMCDVKRQCKSKTEGADIDVPSGRLVPKEEKPAIKKKTKPKPKAKAKPETKPVKEDKPKAKPKPKPKAKKPKAPEPKGMPVFKDMSLDELKELAKQRDVTWKDYGNDNITRMRLTMSLKKSY